MQKKQDFFISFIAIMALTTLEIAALFKGIDGILLTIVVAAISGIAGYKMKSVVADTGSIITTIIKCMKRKP